MGPPVWPAGLAKSLCKPSRGGTCHVPRAPCTPEKYKITRPPVGSIHPENLVRMHCTVFTPDSRKLDRQTDRQEGRRQKMPTYPPSINIRNTKNLHMLKHMNFPLPSYDFGYQEYTKVTSALKMSCCRKICCIQTCYSSPAALQERS